MKIGVFYPEVFPLSMKIYVDTIMHQLKGLGFTFALFKDIKNIPENADLYWDPRVGGGALPEINKNIVSKPIVATLHGTALFTLPIKENRFRFMDTFDMIRHRKRFKQQWVKYQNHFEKIITVSNYAKDEIVKNLSIDAERIIPIHHAVDETLFYPENEQIEKVLPNGYFLHVSVFQPKKNIDRLIKAYLSITDQNETPNLILLVPGYNKTCTHPKVSILTKQQSREEVATFLQNAFGFIFPSLHESFGLPIIEAMACGVPVITSNVTGCPEIAGGAAILVNPRSTKEIADALLELTENRKLREEIINKGLVRCSNFSWRKSASKHAEIFNAALNTFNNKSNN